MRSLFLAVPVAALLGVACSSGANDGKLESNQTEEELATNALKILGAQRIQGANQMCNNCHDVNQATLKQWGEMTKVGLANLNDPNKTAKQKVDGLRLDPTDPNAPFSATRLGVLAASMHLPDSALQKQLVSLFNEAFGPTDGPVQYKKLQKRTGMPMGAADDERLPQTDYDTVTRWFEAGLPRLTSILVELPQPTSCEENLSDELKSHITSMKTKGWAAKNREQQMPMFACTSSDASTCFGQKRDDAKDVFPVVETLEFGKTWRGAGSKMRLLTEIKHSTSFWSRNSADGRFVSAGGGELGAFVIDFAKQLETKGLESREIGVPALFDPSFMPDNSGLLIQGSSGDENDGEGTHFCTQDLFTSAATKDISFKEKQCSSLSGVQLYQSVGRRLADNELSDYFIINNSFESDDGFGEDPVPTFGQDQKITVRVMVSLGSDQGFKMGQVAQVDAPFEGDTMVSPTTSLTVSRIGGVEKQQGYSIRRLVSTPGADGFSFEAKQVGKICIPGGKANFSFDERYLATHHYLTREDFASDAEFAPFKDKATADIYVVDLLTGEKIRVTHMAPGQLALFPHFRSDGWLYITVRDRNTDKEYYVASDAVLGRE